MAQNTFPVCPTGCTTSLDLLGLFNFSECAPQVNSGEIRYIYVGVPGNAFDDWEDPLEWAARLAPANATATKIIRWTVLGDKPKPGGTPKDISGGRKILLFKDHVINATVDETSPENHEAFRKMECGGITLPIWYETAGGKMFGGPAGINVSIDPGMVIPRGTGDNITWELALSWKAKFTEQMITSPIA